MNKINKIHISGFKSIRDQEIELRPINVLVGANGAGKSNFVSIFNMLNFIMTESLQLFVGRKGGANSILHYGAKKTPQMEVSFAFETDNGLNQYAMRLAHAAGDTLIFSEETIYFNRRGYSQREPISLGAGHKESLLGTEIDKGDGTARTMKWMMDHWQAYQFHDTSNESDIRQKWYINDGTFLKDGARNLAAFLYGIRLSYPSYYKRIISTIQLALPFFDDFILEPTSTDKNSIILDWKERGSDYRFGPNQIADGALRFMALATLLLQPREKKPSVIIIDEPELGLHPYAISLLGSLIKNVSSECQVIIATQSTELLDQFTAEDIIVVDRGAQESTFSRLDSKKLEEWLTEYSISEMWKKNIIGGRPHR